MRAQNTVVARVLPVVVSILAALAVSGCGGKGTEGTCTTYPACGGEPKGDWTLAEGCLNLIVSPYQQPSLPDQLAQPQTITLTPRAAAAPRPAATGARSSSISRRSTP